MADPDDGLLGIEVDADDYAETAAGDSPTVSRTYQSEADFQAQKASYSAKIDEGNNYAQLIKAVPSLDAYVPDSVKVLDGSDEIYQLKLNKKQIQLLGYAVGEMYYDREYQKVIDLCQRVSQRCDTDEKLRRSLEKWSRRCNERLTSQPPSVVGSEPRT